MPFARPCADAVGFDCSTKLTATSARALAAMGFKFAIRYVGISTNGPDDIDANETSIIMGEIGALWLVQHPRLPGWSPSTQLGDMDAVAAVRNATAGNYEGGATLWTDLEGIKPGTSPQAVIDYANTFYSRAASEGFPQGVYDGYSEILTPDQLFHSLKTTAYWSDFETKALPVRGFALKQVCNSLTVLGVGFDIDIDLCHADLLGDRPTWMAA